MIGVERVPIVSFFQTTCDSVTSPLPPGLIARCVPFGPLTTYSRPCPTSGVGMHSRANPRTRHKLARERVEAMREIWTKSKPEYHGEMVDFGPMMTWPKPVQKPHPPVLVGGAFPYGARRAIAYGDGWMPHRKRPTYDDVAAFVPQFRGDYGKLRFHTEDLFVDAIDQRVDARLTFLATAATKVIPREKSSG
mgnify:CR=1 FL=1